MKTEKLKQTEIGNIPEDWEVKKLNELFKIETGTTPSTKNKEYWIKGKINWLTPADMNGMDNNIVLPESRRKITQSALNETNLTLMPINSIIISTRAPVGYVGIVREETTFNQGCKGLIPKDSGKIFTQYYIYYLLSKKDYLNRISGGSTFKELSKNGLVNLLVPFPPFIEQKSIFKVLSTVDDAISKVDKSIEKTERLKKGLIQGLLNKGIKHKDFKKVRIGLRDYKIPNSWNVTDLLSSSTLKGRIGWQGLTRKEYLEKGDYYLVTGTDFDNDKVDWAKCYYVKKERYDQDSNIQLKEEDILITKDGSIGKIAFIDFLPKKAALNSGIFVIRPKNNEYIPKFVYFIMKSRFFYSFLNVIAGSTIAHLYQRDFIKFQFPLPPIPEQQKIVAILSTVDKKISLQKSHKQKLERIKKGLMNNLLTGKKRIKLAG